MTALHERRRALFEELDYGPAPESTAHVLAWLAEYGEGGFGNFVNGDFCPGQQGCTLEAINPADPEAEEPLAMLTDSTAQDVDAAMKAAEAAFPAWSALSCAARKDYLYAIARAMYRHRKLFAVLEALDNGKTFRETFQIDVPLAIRHFEYHGNQAAARDLHFPHHVPGGVVSCIIPWNFPLLMLAWKIAPALAAGNTVVLKPAETTSLTALLFAQILRDEVGLPAGVVNIVTGGPETGKAMVNHPIPWKIAFTGSTEVGKLICQATAGSGKRKTMELGGKSPFIICRKADLHAAIEGLVNAIWFNQGQVCCAGSRALVHESLWDEFIRLVKARMKNLRGSKPLDKAMDYGAVNSAAQFKKITELLDQGRAEGNDIFQPTCDMPETGWFIPPTLVTGVETSGVLAREEIFGPVLVAMPFKKLADAAKLANNTIYGLAASIWSEDIGEAAQLARLVNAGVIWINGTNQFDATAPFGGNRQSGFEREGGLAGMASMLIEQHARLEREVVTVDDETWMLQRASIDPLAGHGLRRPDRTLKFGKGGGARMRPDGGYSRRVLRRDGAMIGVVGEANRKDVRNLVEAARKAQPGWTARTMYQRTQVVNFIGEAMADRAELLVRTLMDERGCSLPEAIAEFQLCLDRLGYWCGAAESFGGTVQHVNGPWTVTSHHEAIGVLAIRAPDEYPLLGLINTIIPAILMGNTVVCVAGAHPVTAMQMVDVLANGDVPTGVVTLLAESLPCDTAERFANHEEVDAIWYWGTAEGARVVEVAATCNMKHTWTHDETADYDWFGSEGAARSVLGRASQIKTIWMQNAA